MAPDPNILRRKADCAECGAMVLWTQNAWASGDNRAAAYCCVNGHVTDPADTRECPNCGVHDTSPLVQAEPGPTTYACNQCGAQFSVPN